MGGTYLDSLPGTCNPGNQISLTLKTSTVSGIVFFTGSAATTADSFAASNPNITLSLNGQSFGPYALDAIPNSLSLTGGSLDGVTINLADTEASNTERFNLLCDTNDTVGSEIPIQCIFKAVDSSNASAVKTALNYISSETAAVTANAVITDIETSFVSDWRVNAANTAGRFVRARVVTPANVSYISGWFANTGANNIIVPSSKAAPDGSIIYVDASNNTSTAENTASFQTPSTETLVINDASDYNAVDISFSSKFDSSDSNQTWYFAVFNSAGAQVKTFTIDASSDGPSWSRTNESIDIAPEITQGSTFTLTLSSGADTLLELNSKSATFTPTETAQAVAVIAGIDATAKSVDVTGSTGLLFRVRLDNGNTGSFDETGAFTSLSSTQSFTLTGTIDAGDRIAVEVSNDGSTIANTAAYIVPTPTVSLNSFSDYTAINYTPGGTFPNTASGSEQLAVTIEDKDNAVVYNPGSLTDPGQSRTIDVSALGIAEGEAFTIKVRASDDIVINPVTEVTASPTFSTPSANIASISPNLSGGGVNASGSVGIFKRVLVDEGNTGSTDETTAWQKDDQFSLTSTIPDGTKITVQAVNDIALTPNSAEYITPNSTISITDSTDYSSVTYNTSATFDTGANDQTITIELRDNNDVLSSELQLQGSSFTSQSIDVSTAGIGAGEAFSLTARASDRIVTELTPSSANVEATGGSVSDSLSQALDGDNDYIDFTRQTFTGDFDVILWTYASSPLETDPKQYTAIFDTTTGFRVHGNTGNTIELFDNSNFQILNGGITGFPVANTGHWLRLKRSGTSLTVYYWDENNAFYDSGNSQLATTTQSQTVTFSNTININRLGANTGSNRYWKGNLASFIMLDGATIADNQIDSLISDYLSMDDTSYPDIDFFIPMNEATTDPAATTLTADVGTITTTLSGTTKTATPIGPTTISNWDGSGGGASCDSVSVTVTNTVADGITLTMTSALGSGESYEIGYKTSSQSVFTTTTQTGTTFDIPNVVQGTVYNYRVRRFCGGSDFSVYTIGNVTAAQDVVVSTGCQFNGLPGIISGAKGYAADLYSSRSNFSSIYRVTNGNTSGAGSLNEAINSGADLIIMLYGGRYNIGVDNKVGDCWLDGAFAPSVPRIVMNSSFELTYRGQIIVSYVRFSRVATAWDAFGPRTNADTLGGDLLLANCSFAQGGDECLDILTDFTDGKASLYRCIVADGSGGSDYNMLVDGTQFLSAEESIFAGDYSARNPLTRARHVYWVDNIHGPKRGGGTYFSIEFDTTFPGAGTYVTSDNCIVNNLFKVRAGDDPSVFRDDQIGTSNYQNANIQNSSIFLQGNFGWNGAYRAQSTLYQASISANTKALIEATSGNGATLPDCITSIPSAREQGELASFESTILANVGPIHANMLRDPRDHVIIENLRAGVAPGTKMPTDSDPNTGDGVGVNPLDGTVSTALDGYSDAQLLAVQSDGRMLYEVLRESHISGS